MKWEINWVFQDVWATNLSWVEARFKHLYYSWIVSSPSISISTNKLFPNIPKDVSFSFTKKILFEKYFLKLECPKVI